MKKIELRPYGRGNFVLIDDDDYDQITQWKWSLRGRYAVRFIYKRDSTTGKHKQHRVWMHRAILSTPADLVSDHINGNGLDNRRVNLRVATEQQNKQNRRSKRTSSSVYVGVSWSSKYRRWIAQLVHNGSKIFGGYFITEEQAALIYNHFAYKYRGDFAHTNLIPDSVMSLQQQSSFVDQWLQRGYSQRLNTSGFRGVTKNGSGWRAAIRKNGVIYRLGTYATPALAARQYDTYAIRLYGSSARLNFKTL